MAKEITEIFDIEVEEISVVDRPASPGAKIALFKREPEEGDDMTDTTKETAKMGDKDKDMDMKDKMKDKAKMGDKDDMDEMDMKDKKKMGEMTRKFDSLVKSLEAQGFKVSTDESSGETSVTKTEVETVQLDGESIAKSDVSDKAFAALRKSEERIAKMEARIEAEELAKRADSQWAHIGGSTATRSAMLKALEGIEDESARTEALNLMKGFDEGISKGFTEVGSRTSAHVRELVGLVEKGNGTPTSEEIMKAVDTPEGREAILAV